MARIGSEEAPCRPNGTTLHSNWPNLDRKLVPTCPRPAPGADGNGWSDRVKPRDPRVPSSGTSMCGPGSDLTAGLVMALRPR